VIIDDFSKLPPGAAIYTYSSLPPYLEKPAYQDAAGQIPYTDPIVGKGNGTFDPIFWEFDSANPNDLYYIEVWSGVVGVDDGAVLLWTFDGLTGTSAGGGGGGSTSFLDITNLVINGEFYNNTGNQPIAPLNSVPELVILAPSNNAGYVNDPANVNGYTGGDIAFAKSNLSATDSITYKQFLPLGMKQLPSIVTNQPTPQIFVEYACTNNTSNESYKFIQFPLVKGLKNTSGVIASFQIFSNYISGSQQISLQLRQFFGSGTGSQADVITPLGLLNTGTPGTWTATQFINQIIPAISGTVGSCGNDALFLQIVLPASSLIDIQFILPSAYLSSTLSLIDFNTMDFVNAIVNSPRTGDVRTSLNSFLPGWVAMNDGTIGNESSNAQLTTGGRANQDTFALFNLIWQTFNANQTLAPMYTSGGVPVAYGTMGGTAISDFVANNQISLTKNAGRVMAGALPVASSQTFTVVGNTLAVASTAGFYDGMAVTVNVTGGALTAGVIYYAIVESLISLSLATTTANALAGTVIVLGAVPNGTVVSVNVETIGSFIGSENYPLAANDLPAHTHVGFGGSEFVNTGAGGHNYGTGAFGTMSNSNTGNNATTNNPISLYQPTVFMNVMIKL
jgi:hypothetical protein